MERPKHQAQFVPSGYLAFTRDMLTPDLLFSICFLRTHWGSQLLCWAGRLEDERVLSFETQVGGWEDVEQLHRRDRQLRKEDVGYEREGIINWSPESVRLEGTSGVTSFNPLCQSRVTTYRLLRISTASLSRLCQCWPSSQLKDDPYV